MLHKKWCYAPQEMVLRSTGNGAMLHKKWCIYFDGLLRRKESERNKTTTSFPLLKSETNHLFAYLKSAPL
jgi:hypothetical protein